MRGTEPGSLWDRLSDAGHLLERTLCAVDARVTLADLTLGSSLGDALEALRDASVLVATSDQLTAARAITGRAPAGPPTMWSTFYDIRRYGGLQIFLRALLGGGSMVLSSARESIGDFLARAGAHGVSHISGTPSHWRQALMSPAARRIAPRYVPLSGEIADQAIV